MECLLIEFSNDFFYGWVPWPCSLFLMVYWLIAVSGRE